MPGYKKVKDLNNKLISWRRDFHKHPESGWIEYRTSAIIAETLEELGFDVKMGDEVCKADVRMGVPSNDVLLIHEERALQEGVSISRMEKMKGGKTGVVGILHGKKPGPVCALRFDIDANDLNESACKNHRPVRDGFASIHPGMMHACGHDGHSAIGLGVAEVLSANKEELVGEVRLIFQPAEEGCRGAKSIVAAGWLDGVNCFFSGHIGFRCTNLWELALTEGFYASSKINVTYIGKAAHAGANPEEGRNALLAAASASLQLHGIPRHQKGITRINVGRIEAGCGRNVIPDKAYMEIETRGQNEEINRYMESEAIRIVESAARAYDLKCIYEIVGQSSDYQYQNSAAAVTELVRLTVEKFDKRIKFFPLMRFDASEDVVYMLNRVNEGKGQAGYIMFGSELHAGHHQDKFDFNEDVLELAVEVFTRLIFAYQKGAIKP